MVGDGLNSPRYQGGKPISPKQILSDKYKMRNTRVLEIRKSQLKELPEQVVKVACEEEVNVVNLGNNLFTDLPIELKTMSEQMTKLVMDKNQLSYVPTFISQFTRLTCLNLSCNMLRSLPMELAGIVALRELDISHNRFDHLPECIYELENLEKLFAQNNRIKYIVASENGLGALHNLSILDLSNNDIQVVPPVLGNLRYLTYLKLSGNPFRHPRHYILTQGTAAILEYLRGRIPRE